MICLVLKLSSYSQADTADALAILRLHIVILIKICFEWVILGYHWLNNICDNNCT